MGAIRNRFTVEALPGKTRAELADALFQPLRAYGRLKPEVTRDMFEAQVGDADGDGAPDLDLSAVLAGDLSVQGSGWDDVAVAASLRQMIGGVRFEETLTPASADVTVDPSGTVVTVDVSLARGPDGKFSPVAGLVPEGSRGVTSAAFRQGFNGLNLELGGTWFPVSWPMKVPGLPDEAGNALVEALLTAKLPEGAPLAPALAKLAEQVRAQKLLDAATEPPADPALAVVWRAGRVTSADFEQLRAKLLEKYGARPLKYTGYINQANEAPVVRDVLAAANTKHGITPSFLYAIAMGEGLNLWLDLPHTDVAHETIDGFSYLGTDTFGSRVADLKAKKLLPESFKEGVDYTVTTAVNELNQTVKSASFPTLKGGLIALEALLADERRRFLSDAKSVLGATAAAKLTADQINYFTYLYFNAGSGFGKRQLVATGLKGAEKWQGAPPADNRIARFNSLQRVATWRTIEGLHLFPS